MHTADRAPPESLWRQLSLFSPVEEELMRMGYASTHQAASDPSQASTRVEHEGLEFLPREPSELTWTLKVC